MELERTRSNQSTGSGRSSHPKNIVVTPLNIHAVVLHQGIHHDIRTGTTVIDISDDMQPIHRQMLDELTQLYQEVRSTFGLDDGRNDVFVIIFLFRWEAAILISSRCLI